MEVNYFNELWVCWHFLRKARILQQNQPLNFKGWFCCRILARIRSAAMGNFSDCDSVGEGVSEMRIHFGPGYRVYFMRNGSTVYILLTGGDKSTQKRDIARAKLMARKIREEQP